MHCIIEDDLPIIIRHPQDYSRHQGLILQKSRIEPLSTLQLRQRAFRTDLQLYRCLVIEHKIQARYGHDARKQQDAAKDGRIDQRQLRGNTQYSQAGQCTKQRPLNL